jgi:hypothetical protein
MANILSRFRQWDGKHKLQNGRAKSMAGTAANGTTAKAAAIPILALLAGLVCTYYNH